MKKFIAGGVYVVVDPAMDAQKIIKQLKPLCNEPLAAIQIWDNPRVAEVDQEMVRHIVHLFRNTRVPVIMNNRYELIDHLKLDGLHLDDLSDEVEIKNLLSRKDLVTGITVMNDVSAIRKADRFGIDYISFCSVFPSITSNSCEIVRPETIISARALTNVPIFLSGGVTTDRIAQLAGLPFNGVAVVSAVMQAADPLSVVREYGALLRKYKIISTDEVGYY